MKRNKSRTILIVLSMVISVVSVITISSYFSMSNIQQNYNLSTQGDFVLRSPIEKWTMFSSNEEVIENLKLGFKKEDVQYLSDMLPGCTVMAQSNLAAVYSGWRGDTERSPAKFGVSVLGVDKSTIRYMAPDITSEQIDSLKKGESCLYYKLIGGDVSNKEIEELSNYAIEGDTIMVAAEKYTIIYDVGENINGKFLYSNDNFVSGMQVILHENEFNRICNMEQSAYSNITLVINNEESIEKVVKAGEAIKEKYPITVIDNRYSSRKIHRSTLELYEYMGYLLTSLVAAVGIFNIISTTYTNIQTRVKEIGTMRAIGMNVKQLYDSFIFEGVIYATLSSGIGVILGLSISWYKMSGFLEANPFSTYVISKLPWLSIVFACAAAAVVCILAVYIPIKKYAKWILLKVLNFQNNGGNMYA